LTLDVTVSGQRRSFWTRVDLDPGTSIRFSIKLLTPVELPGIGLCATQPGGIVDGQEPVAVVFLLPPE
jgi:hypothetical protein